VAVLTDAGVVRASGGVVWRMGDDGEVRVLLVHRPHYDDWTIPKGKVDPGETDEQCAVREVEEETGFRCVLGHELVGTEYIDRKGRPKRVRYWEMTIASGGFEPTTEVDDVRWLVLDEAKRLVSYPRDVEVLESFALFAR
jgi:8-oxo-dGTP pyrophosphatase MutT (NUDIX family)